MEQASSWLCQSHHEIVFYIGNKGCTRPDRRRSSGCPRRIGHDSEIKKDIKVVAEAADGKETCELYNELAPDVLLLDLRMPEKDGLKVITELMSHGEPKPRIIVMTTYESEGDVRRALQAGARSEE